MDSLYQIGLDIRDIQQKIALLEAAMQEVYNTVQPKKEEGKPK